MVGRVVVTMLAIATTLPVDAQTIAPGAMPASPGQVTSGMPLTRPVRQTNPRTIAGATGVTRITVTFIGTQGGKIVPSSPAGAFSCQTGTLPPFVTVCTRDVSGGGATTLKVVWLSPNPQASNGIQVGGAQWGGDCAGTAGDSCMLAMSGNRTVTVDPTKPGGVPVPMGTTED